MATDRLNILLVDDQPAKLLTYETILGDLGENLIKADSAQSALEVLLKVEVAVVLVDVCMPDLDGFELAEMIRAHPRFKKTAIIFISAVQLTDMDRLRGYELGAVDYVPVPVVPEVLRAKVRIFAELYRKTRDLQKLNDELEQRVAERTQELEASNARLMESEQRRSLALAAGNMGSWELDVANGVLNWDQGQSSIFGVDFESFTPTEESLRPLIHPEDWEQLESALGRIMKVPDTLQAEFRVIRPDGEVRWCVGTAASSSPGETGVERVSGVTFDITERKRAEDRQTLLAREVDHRARNALAVTQSVLHLTRSNTLQDYRTAVQGRIAALARVHTLISEARWRGADLRKLVEDELAPFATGDFARVQITGPPVSLAPATVQSLALVIHELATNAAKYGALSSPAGRVALSWETRKGQLNLEWGESGGPECSPPSVKGFGTRIIGATIQGQLQGTASFEWREEGLRCLLSFPIEASAKVRTLPDGATAMPSLEHAKRNGSSRVLLLEDEATVALMMGEFLAESGLGVVGPFSRTADALAAIRTSELDAAILDVNLGSEFSYPVAEMLLARDVPFIFVTGYGEESIDERFLHVPVFQKPVDRDALRSALFGALRNRLKLQASHA